ncbi:YqzE family protein [Paenibacillus septentrionalis]|uniref:YqzE family protein n=1 Tax=Paenibacillus septentrionalis TaxID=429342 RepID=A0ABW1V1Z1_9BACL
MGKISGQEYVQYLTEQLVEYMETPANQKNEAKKIAKAHKEPWLVRWFGVGGASLLLWLNKRRTKVNPLPDHKRNLATLKPHKE